MAQPKAETIEKGADNWAGQLFSQAQDILRGNDKNGRYTVPAAGMYPHQWLWDSCFVAIGLRHYNVKRAQAEITSLFRGQWSNGMLPNMVFNDDGLHRRDRNFWRSWVSPFAPDNFSTSGITQPPMVAEAVVKIGQKMTKAERRTWYQKVYPKLVKYHQWLYADRDPHGEGLVLLVHPWETGQDNTPVWISQLHSHQLTWWIRAAQKLHLESLINFFRRDVQFVPPEQRLGAIDALALYSIQHRLRRKAYAIDAILEHSLLAIEDVGFNAVFIRANQHLQTEIAERKRAEEMLKNTLDDLVQTGKMAVLGQMSAGITHELNQPLAALRTLSANAVVFLERGQSEQVDLNLRTICELTDRMGQITAQLKKFARRSAVELQSVALADVIADALFLLGQPQVTVDDNRIQGEIMRMGMHGEEIKSLLVKGAAQAHSLEPATDTSAARQSDVKGDSLFLAFKEKSIDSVQVFKNADGAYFDVDKPDYVNKMSGDYMVLRFNGKQVASANVLGGAGTAKSTYYHFEKKQLKGRNDAEGDTIDFAFKAGKIEEVMVKGSAKGVYLGEKQGKSSGGAASGTPADTVKAAAPAAPAPAQAPGKTAPAEAPKSAAPAPGSGSTPKPEPKIPWKVK